VKSQRASCAIACAQLLLFGSCVSTPKGERPALPDTGFGDLGGFSRCHVGQEAGHRADGTAAHCCHNAVWGRPKTGDVDFGTISRLFLGAAIDVDGLFSATLKMKQGSTVTVAASYRYEWVADHRTRVHCNEHGHPVKGRCEDPQNRGDAQRLVAAKYVIAGKFQSSTVQSAETRAEVNRELTKLIGGHIQATADSTTTTYESGDIELCNNKNHPVCADSADISAAERKGAGWTFHGIRGEHPDADKVLRPINETVSPHPTLPGPGQPTPAPKPPAEPKPPNVAPAK
jgi:hypothetical protein